MFEPVSNFFMKDCTGSTQAGVKWVRRIHSAISESHPTVNPVPPPYLKYNPHSQCHYFTFNIEPAYRSRLDDLIPGGYENAGWIMSYVTEPDAGNKFVGITKNEGHQGRSQFSDQGFLYPGVPANPVSEQFECCLPVTVKQNCRRNWMNSHLSSVPVFAKFLSRNGFTNSSMSWWILTTIVSGR